jgi:hypothetical protein
MVKGQQPIPQPEKAPIYETPAIVYEGVITTRAGTPEGDGSEAVDPAELFGNND